MKHEWIVGVLLRYREYRHLERQEGRLHSRAGAERKAQQRFRWLPNVALPQYTRRIESVCLPEPHRKVGKYVKRWIPTDGMQMIHLHART